MSSKAENERFMRVALEQAELAAAEGEVPVGAAVVLDGRVIATGRNRRERDGDALAHAELLAIKDACRAVGSWRLTGCTLYVTLEPCAMCAGAAVNARIKEVVYGARDTSAGACGSVIDLFVCPLGHRPEKVGGVLEEECAGLLRRFFGGLR